MKTEKTFFKHFFSRHSDVLKRKAVFVVSILFIFVATGCAVKVSVNANTSSSSAAASGVCDGSTTVGHACSEGGIYAGVYGGSHYMATDGHCSNSATPICTGATDNLNLEFDTTNSDAGFASANSPSDGTSNSTYLAGVATSQAALYCTNMIYAGYSDWFLLSVDEAEAFILPVNILAGISAAGYYWTSSADTGNTAYAVYSGGSTAGPMNTSILVRCFRKY